jgi:Predicted ABC-type transport system involved in lysophospholipase L1 biosynthesis, permease component
LTFLPSIARRLAFREALLLARTARGTFLSLGLAALLFTVTLLAGLGVQRAVESSGAELLGGDIEIRSVHRPVDEQAYLSLEGVTASARMTSLRSMIEVEDQRRLVQVTAVDGAWPIRGDVVAEPANAFEVMGREGGVLLEPGLMERLTSHPVMR